MLIVVELYLNNTVKLSDSQQEFASNICKTSYIVIRTSTALNWIVDLLFFGLISVGDKYYVIKMSPTEINCVINRSNLNLSNHSPMCIC